MSKTLIVSYIPRGERSKTGEILQAFRDAAAGKTEIEELDLITDTPDMFLGDNLMAYVLRDMAGQEISPEQQALLEKMDRHCAQLMTADNLVLAYPTYNFSMPAVVKAWIDEIVQTGKTFSMTMEGDQPMFEGLMKGKSALIINTRGGMYSDGPMKEMEHAVTLGVHDLAFLGYDMETAVAEGVNMLPPEEVEKTMAAAKEKAVEVAEKWFG